MGKQETLRQFLSYNKEINKIDEVFLGLYDNLEFVHSNGYYVTNLNSDSVFLEMTSSSSFSNSHVFKFSGIVLSNNPEKDFHRNMMDLSTLAVGAFVGAQIPNNERFYLDEKFIRDNFDELASFIPNQDYFRNIFVDGNTSTYYSDFINQRNGASRSNGITKVKANAYGKMYNDDESAFVQIVFYPVIIITIITIIAIVSKFLY